MYKLLVLAGFILIAVFIGLFVSASRKRKRLLQTAKQLVERRDFQAAVPVLLEAYVSGIQRQKWEAEANIGLSQKKSLFTQKAILEQLCQCVESNKLNLACVPIADKVAAQVWQRVLSLGRRLIDGTVAQDLQLLLQFGMAEPPPRLVARSCPICLNWIRKDDLLVKEGTRHCIVCHCPLYRGR